MIRLLAIFALAFAGCQTGAVTLPPIPAWQVAAADPIPAVAVRTEIAILLPGVPIRYSDSEYTPVSYAWLQSFLDWEWEVAKDIGADYTAESFDCDDFALGFYFAATLAVSKAHVHAAPLIARIVIIEREDPPAMHEEIAVMTDRGLLVVEPQPAAGPFRAKPFSTLDTSKIVSVTLGD